MHNAEPDENILQTYPASCAIKCQQIILYSYGIDVSEAELCRIGKENGWYDENIGVYMHSNGYLLKCFGIKYKHSQSNGLEDLQSELELGHKVMVSVNQAKLASKIDIYNQASHSVIVNVIDSPFVYVTNPGSGNANEKYPITLFFEAWRDSGFYMLSTCEKAPYRYDSQAKRMIEQEY